MVEQPALSAVNDHYKDADSLVRSWFLNVGEDVICRMVSQVADLALKAMTRDREMRHQTRRDHLDHELSERLQAEMKGELE